MREIAPDFLARLLIAGTAVACELSARPMRKTTDFEETHAAAYRARGKQLGTHQP
jgi:hypothetical protein